MLHFLTRDKTYRQSNTFWTFFHVFLCIRHRGAIGLQQITYESILHESTRRTIKQLKRAVGIKIFKSEYAIFNRSCCEKFITLAPTLPNKQNVTLFELERIYTMNHSLDEFQLLMISMWSIQKEWLMLLVEEL